jgi:hypothetical protein
VVAGQRSQEIEVILAERRQADEALAELAGFTEEEAWWNGDGDRQVLPAAEEVDAESQGDTDAIEPVESVVEGEE